MVSITLFIKKLFANIICAQQNASKLAIVYAYENPYDANFEAFCRHFIEHKLLISKACIFTVYRPFIGGKLSKFTVYRR